MKTGLFLLHAAKKYFNMLKRMKSFQNAFKIAHVCTFNNAFKKELTWMVVSARRNNIEMFIKR